MTQFTVAQALTALENAPDQYVELFAKRGVSLEIYKPEKVDLQQPHERDEIYVVISGNGYFVNGKERSAFSPGDVLFVPAQVEHRFEQFSDDFSTWVIFFDNLGDHEQA